MAGGYFDLWSVLGAIFPSSNLSSAGNSGFEENDGRYCLFNQITTSSFTTTIYSGLQIAAGSKTITAAEAKKLPGVTAAEEITVYFEQMVNNLEDNRAAEVHIDFYDDSATQRGSTQTFALSEANDWKQTKQVLTVPASATRVNVVLKTECGAGETIKHWLANVKIKR